MLCTVYPNILLISTVEVKPDDLNAAILITLECDTLVVLESVEEKHVDIKNRANASLGNSQKINF